jgi:hypothetical protein
LLKKGNKPDNFVAESYREPDMEKEEAIIPAAGIVTRTWPVLIKNYWFAQRPQAGDRLDIARLHSIKHPLAGGINRESWTLLIDLTRTEAEILAEIEPYTRRQLRRALRERVKVEWPEAGNPRVLEEFAAFYRRFAASKGELAPVLMASLKLKVLHKKAAAGLLGVSRALDPTGEVLGYLLTVAAGGRARNHLSCSLFREKTEQRQYLGRAKRYLQWRNIIYYREAGFEVYDFGGWYNGRDDLSLLQVNQFKEAFGGVPVKEYDVLWGVSPKGRLFLPLQGIYRRLQEGMTRLPWRRSG